MNVGDRVRCIQPDFGLSLGHVYSIVNQNRSFVAVEDENGVRYGAFDGQATIHLSRFEPVTENNWTVESAGTIGGGVSYDKLLTLTLAFNSGESNPALVENPEYLRGQVELIADAFCGLAMDLSTRVEVVEEDLARKQNEIEDERSTERAIAGGKVVDALTELYVLVDGDEAAVGEMMYEIDKAARQNAQEG